MSRSIRAPQTLRAEHLAQSGATTAAEQAANLWSPHGGVLVDYDEPGSLVTMLPLVVDRDEVLDDRRADHRRRQRSPISFEPEEDDVGSVERVAEIDLGPTRCRIKRWASV